MGHILKIQPVFKEMIWGGHKLRDIYGYDIPSDQTGECWAISGHKNGDCIIGDGEYQGKSVAWLFENHRELFGDVEGNQFPLLVKIIDAKNDLSVQVHPNDEYAGKHENSLGKTECWYVLQADEGTKMVMGHHAKTKEEFVKAIENDDYDVGRHPIATNQVASLYGIVRDSFMTFYDGCLYVGCFTKYTDSAIARYAVDDQGNLINTMDEGLGMNFGMAVPLDYSTISEQAQGMTFYNDKLLLSHSFGILPSRVVFYEKSDKRLYVDENSAVSYRFPERIEQIFVDGDDLYVLFESAAYAYSSASVNIVDRVLKLSLPRMEEYQQSIQSNVSQY